MSGFPAWVGRAGCGPLAAALPYLGEHEVADADRGDDAERDPLDAVGQERARVQVGQRDLAEAAGLIGDELQV